MINKNPIKTVRMKHEESGRIVLINHFDVENAEKNGYTIANIEPEKEPEAEKEPETLPPDAEPENKSGLRGSKK
jgi:hypothetical protein